LLNLPTVLSPCNEQNHRSSVFQYPCDEEEDGGC
jgi:hypothetical protein